MAYLEREYQLPRRRNEEEIRIFVDNLPDELNEDGIAQLFKSYGDICSLLSPPGAKYAFVGYKTYREAEHAIRALNERSPLYLKVAFSKKKPQNKHQKYIPPMDAPASDFQRRDYRYATNGISHNTGSRRIMPKAITHIAQYPNFNRGLEALNSVYPCDLDHTMYSPYETAGRYADTNAMWSRGCVNIDEYGKRYVSMGRGYTRYHIPEPHPNIEEHLGRVYEKRRAGFYQYGDDSLQSDVGKCQFCTNVTKLRCEKCNGFYCSRECQLADWPRHKLECRTIPFHSGLIGDLETTSLSRSSSDEHLLVPRKPGGMDLRALGALRRPKRVIQMENMKVAAGVTPEQDQSVPREQAPIQHDSMPSRGEARNEISKMNGATAGIEASQQIRQQCSIQNDNQGLPKGDGTNGVLDSNDFYFQNQKRYDQNGNGRYNDGNAISGNGVTFDRKGFRPYRDNRASDNFKSGRGCSDSSSGPTETRRKGSQSGSLIDLAKEDLMKMEQDLAFQRDPRAQVNVENQTPVFCESLAILPPAPQETATNAASILVGTFLSKDEFTSVIIVVDMPDATFWVHKEVDASNLGAMMGELNEKADDYPKVPEIVIGETYAVKYENFWHRATVVSKKPPEIFYIDYGNAEPPQSDDFRLLKDFPIYPAFAIRIRLSNNLKAKDVTVDDKLSVKMINIDKDGVVEVEEATSAVWPVESPKTEMAVVQAPVTRVEPLKVAEIPQIVSPTAAEAPVVTAPKVAKVQKQPAVKLPSLIDTLGVNDEGYVQVYMALNDKSYAVCVLTSNFQEQFQLIYEQLPHEFAKAVKPQNFLPQVGDFVCGKREQDWLRGYVFSLGPPIRLALVDEARISQVEQVLPMPDEYAKACSFGSICTFDVPGSTFDVDENAQFRVTGVKDVAGERVVNAIIVESDRLKDISVTLKNWRPTPEQKGIGLADLKPNTEVCITAYSSERIMFVRSLDAETLERTQRITQNVAKWAQTAPMLDGPPAIGQLVIAKYADGNYYRAIVTKLIDGKISVSYIDYGNRDVITIDQLRLLSDDLKEQKSCAAKVLLKDIQTGVVPTKDVHQYLDILVGKEQPLFCTFEGIPSKDGVILTTANGECVNTRVNEYLTPSWQREDPAKNTKCFMLDDFKFAILGEVGKVVKAIVLHVTESSFKYIMSPVDQEVISHVTSDMSVKMREYCEATKEHYIPRFGELCLAVYLDQWYRGVCLNRSETSNQALIQFIDYGNVEVVDHKNIRPMIKEFNDVLGLGCSCTVNNLGIELVNGQVPTNIKMRLDDLIQTNNFIDVMITKESDGDYEVELPEVKKTLIAEGLVKP